MQQRSATQPQSQPCAQPAPASRSPTLSALPHPPRLPRPPLQLHHGVCDAVCHCDRHHQGPAGRGGRPGQQHLHLRHAHGRAQRGTAGWVRAERGPRGGAISGGRWGEVSGVRGVHGRGGISGLDQGWCRDTWGLRAGSGVRSGVRQGVGGGRWGVSREGGRSGRVTEVGVTWWRKE